MVRTDRTAEFTAAIGRPVPPLPHPSWLYGSNERTSHRAPIVPAEFWRRLGL
jgi:hypothetical protein